MDNKEPTNSPLTTQQLRNLRAKLNKRWKSQNKVPPKFDLIGYMIRIDEDSNRVMKLLKTEPLARSFAKTGPPRPKVAQKTEDHTHSSESHGHDRNDE